MAFVLDASVALAWCFHDQSSPGSRHLLKLAEDGQRIFIPANWPLEVLNGLLRATRRGRLDEVAVDQFLADVRAYDIVVDSCPVDKQWAEARQMAIQYRLSAYDAGYLALAKRLGVSLATFDKQLQLAAEVEGVPLAL